MDNIEIQKLKEIFIKTLKEKVKNELNPITIAINN